MTLILYIFLLGSLTLGVRTEIVSVDRTPEILPYEASGKITNTALVLGQPLCYFNTLSQVPCTQSTCEVWAAIASGPGIRNFDTDKLDPSLRILKASPYPFAFMSLSSKMYFVTKLGHPRDFPCGPLPGVRYFRIGAEGNCTTTNCNGILPLSSTVSVTYILIDPVSKRVVAESKWSHSISLKSGSSWTSIDTWIWKRSGGMVVITVISSCLLALLLLMFGAVILLDCKGSFRGSHDIMNSPGIFRSLNH